MLDVVRRTAEACFMPLTVGGGVRTIEDIRVLLRSGADKVSINTAAVNRREFVKEAAEKFGDQCIVVAIDAKRVKRAGGSDRWEIFTHGGRNADRHRRGRVCAGGGVAGRRRDAADLDGSRRHPPGLRHSADPRDRGQCSVPVIASGGVGKLDHLVEGIRDGHATAVLAASIFHFGEYTVRAAKEHMAAGRPADAAGPLIR